MYTKITQIKNPTGLHARPASDFVACAREFKSRIFIKRNGIDEDEVDAKSIVMILSLGLAQGEEIQISARGEDEASATDTLIALVESGFGES
jgi:phosphocarrier protein HPr